MYEKEIVVALAEKEMAFRLHCKGTEMPFSYYGCKENVDIDTQKLLVEADPDQMRIFQKEQSCSDDFAEYSCLMMKAGNSLLGCDRMLFHGVGMIYRGNGYVLAAPSGTGKSTQFRNLYTLYGKECRIISGDKPVLRRLSGIGFKIYPSPWNGKENWGGKEEASLKAVIWLSQGKENRIERPQVSEMVLPVLSQIIYDAPDPLTVHQACRMTEDILMNIPIYRFINTGDMDSSKILGKFLDSEAAK